MAQDHEESEQGAEDETYECEKCGQTFDTEEERQEHVKEKHDMGP